MSPLSRNFHLFPLSLTSDLSPVCGQYGFGLVQQGKKFPLIKIQVKYCMFAKSIGPTDDKTISARLFTPNLHSQKRPMIYLPFIQLTFFISHECSIPIYSVPDSKIAHGNQLKDSLVEFSKTVKLISNEFKKKEPD